MQQHLFEGATVFPPQVSLGGHVMVHYQVLEMLLAGGQGTPLTPPLGGSASDPPQLERASPCVRGFGSFIYSDFGRRIGDQHIVDTLDPFHYHHFIR